MNEAKRENTLEGALTDVRRAYRLLWAFQKRMLQYNLIIRERLGFEHHKTDEYFGRSKNTTRPDMESHWTWRYLPLAYVCFVAKKQGSNRGRRGILFTKDGDMLLYIQFVPDSALSDIYDEGVTNEPNPLEFPEPGSCKSSIYIYLCINRKDRKSSGVKLWFDDIEIDWPEHKKVVHVEGVDIYAEIWDMAELPGEKELLAKIDAFSKAASKKLKIELNAD